MRAQVPAPPASDARSRKAEARDRDFWLTAAGAPASHGLMSAADLARTVRRIVRRLLGRRPGA